MSVLSPKVYWHPKMIKYHVSAANILLCGKKIHSCKSATPENIFGRCLEIRLALRHVLTKTSSHYLLMSRNRYCT